MESSLYYEGSIHISERFWSLTHPSSSPDPRLAFTTRSWISVATVATGSPAAATVLALPALAWEVRPARVRI